MSSPTTLDPSTVAPQPETQVHANAPAQRERENVGRLLAAALLTFVVWRGSVLFFDLVGLSLMPPVGRCRESWQVFGKGHEFLNGFFRWDSGWYLQIAKRGYSYTPDGASSVAFYPALPYLSRYLGLLVGGPAIAGLIICNAATVGAIFYVRRLGTLLYGEPVAKLAVTLLLVFPTSFFLSAFYTESLFIWLAAASTYHYFRREFLWCGLFGCGAMLSRSAGLVLFGALSLDLMFQLLRRRERPEWRMLLLLLIPAGLGLFMLMLKQQTGEPLAFAKVMKGWGHYFTWPWEPVIETLRWADYGLHPNFSKVQRLLDASQALAFLGIAASMAWLRYPLALSAFIVIGTLLPLTTSDPSSMNRYVLQLFPAFFFLARICQGRAQLERWLIFSSAFFLGLYSLRFMQCGWAG